MPEHVRVGGDFLRGLFWPGQMVGGRELHFEPSWVKRQLARWRAKHGLLARKRAGDVCILVGNGPSLNEVDFDLFDGYDVFISNYAFFDRKLAARAKYLCIVNYLVAEQEAAAINAQRGTTKLFPYWLSYCLHEDAETYFFDARASDAFSADATRWVAWRSTVTFSMLQIAYSLGYRKVLLTGFDHRYEQSGNAKEGDVLHQADDDRNHFRPDYFKGKRWQAANVANMERAYAIAKQHFERDGREIVNCTVGGHLQTFRRGELKGELMGQPNPDPGGFEDTPSLGFRLRNVALRLRAFCGSRAALVVAVALLALIAINGSSLGPWLRSTGISGWFLDAVSFLVAFTLIAYLWVRIGSDIERGGR